MFFMTFMVGKDLFFAFLAAFAFLASDSLKLIGILAGTIQSSKGNITRYCPCSYIAQLEDTMIPPDKGIDNLLARQFAAELEYSETMSGGEKTHYRLATAFSQARPI
jgi:hypothetical protein